MDDLERAISEMDAELAADARRAIAAVKRGNYSPGAVNRALDFLLARGDSTMRRYLAEQIREGVRVADKVERVYRAWRREGAEPGGAPITAAEAAGVIESGIAPAQASAALEAYAPLSPGRAVIKHAAASEYPKGALDALPRRQVKLSGVLHRQANQRQIRASVHAAIRQGKALEGAARELIRDSPKLGSGQALPKALGAVRKAALGIGDLGGDAQRKAFLRAVQRVERQAMRVVDPATGTRALKDARGGYAEALQILRQKGPAGVDKAMERWMDEKQRSNADRIVRTEAAAANRAREATHIDSTPQIRALIWRMSKGARKGYVARTKIPKKGKMRGHRCICEAMAGEEFPPSAAKEYPRMGHPHCMCWWERVYRDAVEYVAPD
jgi:hypothetical protein